MVLAVVWWLPAFSEARAPSVSVTMMIVAGRLIVLAVFSKLGRYSLETLPHALISVIDRTIA